MQFHEDDEVEDDEPVVKFVASPAAEVARANASHVTSAATAQKQTKRRHKCAGDVQVVPITRYFAATPPAAAAAAPKQTL